MSIVYAERWPGGAIGARSEARQLPLAAQLDAHCAALSTCRRCLHAPGVVPIIASTRAPMAILVGQAPGKTEMEGGRPFAGRAGRTLFKWLALSGLDEPTAREWLYIAAVTRCFPGSHHSGRGDRVPSRAHRSQCAGWLDAELDIIRPSLVIPVGRLAIDRFLGAESLDAVVGRAHEVTLAHGKCTIVPLPHPSGASSWIHNAEHLALLHRSLALIGERLLGRDNLPQQRVA